MVCVGSSTSSGETSTGVRRWLAPTANLLSIRATSPAALDEVLKTLALIDRPQRQIAFQVFVIEFNAKKSDGTDASAVKPEVDTDELTGSAEAVLSKLATWTTAGHVTVVRKYQLTAQENRTADLFLGESKPTVVGFTSNGTTGIATPTLTQLEMGTMISLMPRISETGEIVAKVNVQDSRLEAPEHGIELAKGANGPIISRGIVISRVQTSLTIPKASRASRRTGRWSRRPITHPVSPWSRPTPSIRTSCGPSANRPVTFQQHQPVAFVAANSAPHRSHCSHCPPQFGTRRLPCV